MNFQLLRETKMQKIKTFLAFNFLKDRDHDKFGALLNWTSKSFITLFFIPRRSRRDIILASSVRLSVHSVCPSVHTFCLSGTISQYLLVRFDSILVQMIRTMDSRYFISLVKIDPLTLELLPLF